MNIRDFFYLRRSDRTVIGVMLCLAVGVLLWAFGWQKNDFSTEVAAGDSLRTESARHDRAYHRHGGGSGLSADYVGAVEQAAVPERFYFDPNTADSTQLLRLGLRPWQVRNIYKYRARGGVYRTKQDFARLYGLTQKEYRELESYIIIGSDYQPSAQLVADGEEATASRDTVLYPVKLQPGQQVDLNCSDTSQLKKVPAIGSYYARQVVRYGQQLGGYVSTDQLREIKSFPEVALPFFKISSGKVRKLNLNKLTLNQLKSHPYITFFQARAIIDYRRLKGPLKSLDDLRLLPDFTPEAIRRLQPYVEF